MKKLKLIDPKKVYPKDFQRKINKYVLTKIQLEREKNRLPNLEIQAEALSCIVNPLEVKLVNHYINEANKLCEQNKIEGEISNIENELAKYVGESRTKLSIDDKPKKQKIKSNWLEYLDYEIFSYKDLELNSFEKVIISFDKRFGGGIGKGVGYHCVNCHSSDVYYFKREFNLKEVKWDSSKKGDLRLPPIENFKIPDKLFHIMGHCNSCDNTYKLNARPNKIKFWHDDSYF